MLRLTLPGAYEPPEGAFNYVITAQSKVLGCDHVWQALLWYGAPTYDHRYNKGSGIGNIR